MGCVSTEPASSPLQTNSNDLLTVASLNYCDIMNSPFEFYCQDYLDELKAIGQEFLSVLPLYFPQFDRTTFKWQMGKIDLKIRYRYSPMFLLKAGIHQDGTFMTRSEFEKEWDKVFQAELAKQQVEHTAEQRAVTKMYDVAMWHTLLRYVLQFSQLKEAAGKDSSRYVQTLEPYYNLSFLDEKKKCEKVVSGLDRVNADVFFFQEYGELFYESVLGSDNYYMSFGQDHDTLIMARKSSFKEKPMDIKKFVQTQVGKELSHKLHEYSAYMVIENYLFVNVHLTSKPEPNKQQIEKLKQGILELRSRLPQMELIIGGDINSYLTPFSQTLTFFPSSDKEITTVKQRTYTQGQFSKADKLIRQSKDKIISSLQLKQGKICYIDGEKPNSNTLVPTDDHPFDHFMVIVLLQKKNQS